MLFKSTPYKACLYICGLWGSRMCQGRHGGEESSGSGCGGSVITVLIVPPDLHVADYKYKVKNGQIIYKTTAFHNMTSFII